MNQEEEVTAISTTAKIKCIGFPKMDKEQSEKRDFLPEFFGKLEQFQTEVYLEKGYGAKLGYQEKDYLEKNKYLRFADRDTVFAQELIAVIRVPEFESLEKMKPHSGLLSMLHYETRPKLLAKLKEKDINAFSLDAIVDDQNQRMMVTYEVTALGGIVSAFKLLKQKAQHDGQINKPLKVAIIGMGNLGIQAGRSALQQYSEREFENDGYKGISIEFLEKEITGYEVSIRDIFEKTDLLVDATRRPDATKPIIPNKWLAYLPEDAIILDLTADPYEERAGGTQVKAIEGIPHGTLDNIYFPKDDPEWEKGIPATVHTANRRATVSCNAWPGVMPKECMFIYGEKILPFLSILLQKGYSLDIDSEDRQERALARSTIGQFEGDLAVQG